MAGEILGLRLNTLHNLHQYAEVIRGARRAVEEGRFAAFRDAFLARSDESAGPAGDVAGGDIG
jgi:queuine tRNA-ribosyltransferase